MDCPTRCVLVSLAWLIQDREEVIQEVFLQLFKSIGDYQERTGGSFRGWLRTITSSKIADLIRKKNSSRKRRVVMQRTGPCSKRSANNSAKTMRVRHASSLRRALEQIEGDFDPGVWQAF